MSAQISTCINIQKKVKRVVTKRILKKLLTQVTGFLKLMALC